MNYDSRFSYNLTIPIMEIRLITMKYDEMRHMKTSLNPAILWIHDTETALVPNIKKIDVQLHDLFL